MLVLGTMSLVHNTTFGTFDTFDKLTSAIGTVFAFLSLDAEYQEERRAGLIDKNPKWLGEGVAMGVLNLGNGVSQGITGLITQPIRGAEQDGVAGFFRGVGKGVLGVATKPAVGAFDMCARMFAGIKNTAALLDIHNYGVRRRRLPRHIMLSSQRRLLCYDPKTALVQKILYEALTPTELQEIRIKNMKNDYKPLPGDLILIDSSPIMFCCTFSDKSDSSVAFKINRKNVISFIKAKNTIKVTLSNAEGSFCGSRKEFSMKRMSMAANDGDSKRVFAVMTLQLKDEHAAKEVFQVLSKV